MVSEETLPALRQSLRACPTLAKAPQASDAIVGPTYIRDVGFRGRACRE